jgi:RNA polymerase sigma-70 factor (ECF subfamily)
MWKTRMKADGGGAASLGLCLRAATLDQGGQRTLKLEDQMIGLFDELREPVYRYLLCVSACAADADEIVQETFLKLYQHLHAGGTQDNLRGWVFRVAHNIGVNKLKSRKHLAPSGPEQLPELNASGADPAPGPEELLLRKEKMIRLHAAISTLSEQQRQCLYLRAEGFRYREIAQILGVTISTVEESLRRAIKKLVKGTHG